MKHVTWRNFAVFLAVVCCYQRWQSCTHSPSATVKQAAYERGLAECRQAIETSTEAPARPTSTTKPPTLDVPAITAKNFYGFKVPVWVMHLAPQPGENMRDYRDRILPVAQTVIAPQRARVARTRDDFGTLDTHQRAELDGAVQEAQTAIQDRVMSGLISGELRPATFKPMTGVTMAREILDIIERGNTRFMNSLSPDQRTKLSSHRFDFADYLLFSARWEDALHVLD